ncbi:MAG: glycosyltransferase [Pseudomonadota bacterium]
MRIVFTSSLIPTLPTDSGFEIANRAIVECLIRLGHDVELIGFRWPDRPLQFPDTSTDLGELALKTAGSGTGQKLKWLAQAVQQNTTFAAAKLQVISPDELSARLKKLAPFDALIVNGVPIAGAFLDVLSEYPFIYVAHNQEAVAARHAAENATGFVEKQMYRRESSILKKLETALAEKAAGIIALTDEDRAALFENHTNAITLPLVTPEAEVKSVGQRPIAFDAGMVGTWTWAQNRIGLEWFLQKVMPHMPEHCSIAVAGSLPEDFPRRDKRIHFLGRVLDAKAFIQSCCVSILCARAGTGIQLKTLETLELGLPAVATSSSLRGISRPLPDHFREADDPSAFAETLKSMIVDVRTGQMSDGSGEAFREEQIARMDQAMTQLLEQFTKTDGS